MRTAGIFPLLPAGLGVSILVGDLPGASSRETLGKIRQSLPSYSIPADPSPAEHPPRARNPDTLELPKMTIREPREPKIDPDYMITRRDLNKKMANVYLDAVEEVGPLNRILNSFTIPILSPSRAERGRAITRSREYQRLFEIGNVARQFDGKAAKELQEEIRRTATPPAPAGSKK